VTKICQQKNDRNFSAKNETSVQQRRQNIAGGKIKNNYVQLFDITAA